jgi:hypothetical protein
MGIQQMLLAGGGAGSLLLDIYTGAAAAYSVRKLRTLYAGSALRVVTSAAGNAEQDIGFDGGGNLDTTALLAFIGANNGTVKTWYDQSGNGVDVTQATIANQPRIVTAGALITRNSLPSLLGNGTSSQMASAYSITTLDTSNQNSLFVVHQSTRTSSASEGIFGLQRSAAYSFQSGTSFTRRTTNLAKSYGSGSVAAFNTTQFQGTQAGNSNITTLIIGQTCDNSAGPMQMYVDGTNQVISNFSGSLAVGGFMGDANTSAHRVIMFSDADNAGVNNAWFSGYISEAVDWTSTQLSNRAAIQANQKAYFGTA